MEVRKEFLLLCAVTLATLVSTAAAEAASIDQYYTGWNAHPSGRIDYCIYYFKTDPNADHYDHQFCIRLRKEYFPSKPGGIYFYDPKSGKYWGRYIGSAGEGQYAILKKPVSNEEFNQVTAQDFELPSKTFGVAFRDDTPKLAQMQPPPEFVRPAVVFQQAAQPTVCYT